MTHPRFRTLALLVAALLLGGCQGSSMSKWFGGKEVTVEPNIFPTDYKNEIMLTLQRTLDDPNAIREAQISDPKLEKFGAEERYVACVRFNARDFAKRYTGKQDRIAFFFGGHVNQLIPATPEQCGRAAYKPFPELEKICLTEKCS